MPNLSTLVLPTPPVAAAAMVGAMLIFGTNFAVSRYGIQHGLTAYDLVFFRFGIAGLLLLPYAIRQVGPTCAGIGWRRGALLALVGGAPITILMSLGVTYAPAAHGSALGPGTVTCVGVVYATVMAGVLPPRLVRVGLALALAGLISIAAAGSVGGSRSVLVGDLLFIATGLLWGFYPILLHRWRVGGMQAVAISAVLSLVYVPVYALLLDPQIAKAPLGVVVAQAVYQGLFSTIIGLWLWGLGVRVLGTAGTQFFPPLIPVVGTLAAIPILGEQPGPIQAIGVALIVGGLALSAYGSRPKAPSVDETTA